MKGESYLEVCNGLPCNDNTTIKEEIEMNTKQNTSIIAANWISMSCNSWMRQDVRFGSYIPVTVLRLFSCWCMVVLTPPLKCCALTSDGAQFRDRVGLQSGAASNQMFSWHTPEMMQISNSTYLVRNCETSGLSRVSFEVATSSGVAVAECQVSVYTNSTEAENAVFDNLVFCLAIPIEAYSYSFRGIRKPSGDISVQKYLVPTNILDCSFECGTFGNVNVTVEVFTNNSAIAAETLSNAIKANGCIAYQ